MQSRILTPVMLLVAIRLAAPVIAQAPSTKPIGPARWEAEIAKFEAADLQNPPPPGGIVFVGSSTIRGWNVKKWFPDLPAIQRGFGGSEMQDAAHFVRRIVTNYRPSVVVLYEGDNDIQNGKSPQTVIDELDRFATALHADVPDANLIVLAIKPSSSRWSKYPKMQETNNLFRAYATKRDWITVLDLGPDMLGGNGQPRDELFKDDKLHLNDEGYKLWSEKLRPLLDEAIQRN